MFPAETEYYVRFILLLLDGGTALLRWLVEKALRSINKTFGDFLKENETNIRSDRHVTHDQIVALYPGTPQGAHIDDLDLSLLVYLINKYLHQHLFHPEKAAIKNIRKIRNSYSHQAGASMKLTEFIKEREKLITHFRSGYRNLPQNLKDRLEDVINTSTDNPLDRATVERIQQLDRYNANFSTIQQLLDDIRDGQQQMAADQAAGFSNVNNDMQEVKTMLKQVIEQQQRQGEVKRTVQTISCYVHLIGRDQALVDRAECILLDRLEEHLNNSGEENLPQDDLHKSVQRFLTEINHLNVTVEKVERRSILLTFTCISLEAMSALLEYLDSPNCEMHLGEMAGDLTNIIGDTVDITVSIDIPSLTSAVSKLYAQYNTDYTDADVRSSNADCPGSMQDSKCSVCGHVDHSAAGKQRSDRHVQLNDPKELEVLERDRHVSRDPTVISHGSNIQYRSPDQDCNKYERVLRFKTKCTGPEGLLHLLDIFEGEKADNSLNELSTSISFAVKVPITIHTSIDMQQMKNAIRSIQQQSGVQANQTTEASGVDFMNFPKSTAKNSKELFSEGETVGLLKLEYINKRDAKTKLKNIFNCLALSEDRLLISDGREFYILDLCARKTEKTYFRSSWSKEHLFYRHSFHLSHLLPKEICFRRPMAQLPYDCVALLTEQKRISICKVSNFNEGYRIKGLKHYLSIAYHQDHLYCCSERSVDVLDMQGKIKRRLNTDIELDGFDLYQSAVSKNGANVYVLNHISEFIHMLQLPRTDEETTMFKSKAVANPTSIVVLDDGNLLVSSGTGTIYNFSADLEQMYLLINIDSALSMCYKQETKTVFVGGNNRRIHELHLDKEDKTKATTVTIQHQQTMTEELPCALQQTSKNNTEQLTEESSSLTRNQRDIKPMYFTTIEPEKDRLILMVKDNPFQYRYLAEATCCVVLSSGHRLLANYDDQQLQLIDSYSNIILRKRPLVGWPIDMAALPADKVAVVIELHDEHSTMFGLFPSNYHVQIQIFQGVDLIHLTQIILDRKEYKQVAYSRGHLYLTYIFEHTPERSTVNVDVLDMQGKIQKTVPINITGDFLTSIIVSKTSQEIIICGYKEDTVASVTLEGVVTSTYQHRDMRGPRSLAELDDGSFLVTCSWSGTIHYISSDLKQGYTVESNLPGVWSICYQPSMKRIFVGSMAWKGFRTFSVIRFTDDKTDYGQCRQMEKDDSTHYEELFRKAEEWPHYWSPGKYAPEGTTKERKKPPFYRIPRRPAVEEKTEYDSSFRIRTDKGRAVTGKEHVIYEEEREKAD